MSFKEVTLKDLQEVHRKLKENPTIFFRTPLLENVEQQLQDCIPNVHSLSLKMESMQCTGSFKARGVVNQFLSLTEDDLKRRRTLVTMSAGNYGKAFAHVANIMKMPAVVVMPETAPMDRKYMIESLGASVIRCPIKELMNNVKNHQREHGSLFLHSFDDLTLIKGHASVGLELFDQLKVVPEVVLICCGGGGFLAGAAIAMKLLGWKDTRIYGVEPETAPTMHEALKAGRVVNTNVGRSIASGLSPPFAGQLCFEIIQQHVEGVVLVSDDQIRRAVSALYNTSLVVEPSGAAALAALMCDKIPNVKDKNVVVFVTGGNVSPEDLAIHITKNNGD